MKAKEILAEIRRLIAEGSDAKEALIQLVSKEFKELRQLNADRKGGDAAILRLMKEYNQKWNIVIAQLRTIPLDQYGGRCLLQENDFARMIFGITRDKTKSSDLIEQEIEVLTKPQQLTNQQVADVRRKLRLEQEERETMARFLGLL